MSGLVFAAIAPHGHLAIPEACTEGERGLAVKTQEAMAALGRRFEAARPDVTFIFTPHNIHVEHQFAVVTAGKMAGSLSEWSSAGLTLTVPVDRTVARATIEALNAAEIPATGISYGGNDAAGATAPMDWGVFIPLWFMGGRTNPQAPIVMLSPARDRSVQEHVRAGAVLAQVAAASGKRVALIASCDHGHAHDPNGPYGYDPAAAEYDARMVEIVKENRLGALLEIDPAYVSTRAHADSYWQMLLLYGALGDGWQSDFLSYEAPTYFGMLCAAFAPR